MNSRKARQILRIRPSGGIDPRLPNPIFNGDFPFFFFNEFQRNGVNFENSARKWLIPYVPISYIHLNFPFDQWMLEKKR